jgi:hypothetical protein
MVGVNTPLLWEVVKEGGGVRKCGPCLIVPRNLYTRMFVDGVQSAALHMRHYPH